MKLSEVLTPQEQLDKITLKHAVAVGATALAMATGGGYYATDFKHR